MAVLELLTGQGGLPKARLTAPDGGCIEIYLLGGQVTSWVPAGAGEQLFLSGRALFKPGKAIRGGIPVIFPQFSSRGLLPKHGFARSQTWELDDAWLDGQEARAGFVLRDSEATRQVWDRCFELRLEICLAGRQLQVGLVVSNTGVQPFSFTSALHTYFKITDIAQTAVTGLGGRSYFDHTAGARESVQAEPLLRFSGEVDRLYPGAPPVVSILDGERVIEIQAVGFTDCVVWNPGAAVAATMPDLGEEYRHMVCVEAAAAEHSVMLLPGHTWHSAQILRV